MGNSTLKTVGMELIHTNPYRLLHVYPWIEPKLDALQRSIDDVGFWEGVIARPRKEGGYELAFGHHRIEAAKRSGLNRVPLIIRDLTDEQMVKFMGRENGEDYKADFLSMLNSWEGAKDFSATAENNASIARLLGWMRDGGGHEKMTRVAESCANAHDLIEAGMLDRDDLTDLSVSAVRDLCAPLIRELKSLALREEHLKKTTEPEKVEQAIDTLKKKAATGVKETARDVREGRIASRDVSTTTGAKIREKQSDVVSPVPPDFLNFANRLATGLDNMLDNDSYEFKLKQVLKVIEHLPSGEHMNKVSGIITALDALKNRAEEMAAALNSEVVARYAKDDQAQPKLEVIK